MKMCFVPLKWQKKHIKINVENLQLGRNLNIRAFGQADKVELDGWENFWTK